MALKQVFVGAGKTTAIISEKFDDLLFLALKLAAISVAAIAVYKYSGIRAPADDGLGWWLLFMLGMAAIGFEFYGAQTAIDGWYDRSPAVILLGIGLCVPALALSYSNAISSAAVQQDKAASLQKAAHVKGLDNRSRLKDAEAEVNRIQGRIAGITGWVVDGKPYVVRTAEAAQAAIDNAMAHRFWGVTNGCKETKGPQTRSFCAAYATYRQEKSLAIELKTLEAELPVAKTELNEAQAAANMEPATASEVRADTLEYAMWFGTDTQGAQMMQARHIGLTVTLFVTLAGLLSALKRNRGREVQPWGIAAWVRRMWAGSSESDNHATPPASPEPLLKQDETAVAPQFHAPNIRQAPTHTREIVRTDEKVWRDLRAALRHGQLAA